MSKLSTTESTDLEQEVSWAVSFGGEDPVADVMEAVQEACDKAGINPENMAMAENMENMAAQTMAHLAAEHLKRLSAYLRPRKDVDIDRLQIHLCKAIRHDREQLERFATATQMRSRLQRMCGMVFHELDEDVRTEDDAKDADDHGEEEEMAWTAELAVEGYFGGVQEAIASTRPTTMASYKSTPTNFNKITKSVAAYQVAVQLENIAMRMNTADEYISEEMAKYNDTLQKSPRQMFHQLLSAKLDAIVTIQHTVPLIQRLWNEAFVHSDFDDIAAKMKECAMLPEEQQPEQDKFYHIELLLRCSEFKMLELLPHLPPQTATTITVAVEHAAKIRELDAKISEYTAQYNVAFEEKWEAMELERKKNTPMSGQNNTEQKPKIRADERTEHKHEQNEELKRAEETQPVDNEQTRELRQLRREKVALQELLEKEKRENEQLKAKNQETAQKSKASLDLTQRISKLEREKVALEQQLQKFEDDKQDLALTVALELQNEEELTQRISMFECEKVALEQQLQECEDEKEALTMQYQKLAQAHGTLRDTASASAEEYNAMMEQQKEMTHTISMFEHEKVALEQQLQAQKQKSQEIEDEKEALTIKNQELMQAYGAFRESTSASIEKYNATIEQMHREHVASLAESESQNQTLNDKVRELDTALTLASKNIFELRQTVDKQRQSAVKLTTENDKQRRNIKMLGEQVRRLGNLEIELKSELDEAKSRIVDAEQRILVAQQEIELKNAELEQMDIDTAQRKATEAAKDQLINHLHREKEQLKDYIAIQDQQIKDETARQHQIREEHQNEIARLQQTHDAKLEDEAKEYSEKIDALRDDIAALTNAIGEKERAYTMLSESKMVMAQHTQHAMQQMRNTIGLQTNRKETEPSSVGSSTESESRWSFSSSLDEMMPFSKTWLPIPSFRS